MRSRDKPILFGGKGILAAEVQTTACFFPTKPNNWSYPMLFTFMDAITGVSLRLLIAEGE